MNPRPAPTLVFRAILVVALGACSPTGTSPKGNGSGGSAGAGSTATAGSVPASGGAAGSAGATVAGGTTAPGSSVAGAGGLQGTGGTSGPAGGTVSDGGATVDGRADAGGATNPDAASATGGRPATGGTGQPDAPAATGGRADAGGGTVAGSATVTGGSLVVGGQTGTGGTRITGGTTGGFTASYYLGADITFAESASEAAQNNLLSQLKQHGFNAIRLRTFVDPRASDGYDKTTGCADIAHTVTFGKKVKDLGMALLVDFHYSDNWADPSKQCVPVAWQSSATIDQLATAVHDYTKDSISKLIAGGARPEMVQIGNETTPGMLMHVCDSSGQPTGNNKVTGSTSNWTNLGTLFKAGIKGVKDIDATILTALHIDRCGDKPKDTQGSALSMSKYYISNAINQGVAFDVFGESCYQQYQGDPNNPTVTKAGWTTTLTSLVTAYPNLKFMAAEYGPMQREINDVVYGLANRQGIGTFNWEPDRGGDWNTGHLLFTLSGASYTAGADLALYDQMKIDYASRL